MPSRLQLATHGDESSSPSVSGGSHGLPLNRLLQAFRFLVTPVALLLTAGIFLLDLRSPPGVEVEILYLVPLLLLLRSPNKGAAVALAAAYTVLIVIGAIASPPGVPRQLGLAMRAIVAAIIWLATMLVLRVKRAEQRLFLAQKERQTIFDSVPAMIWYKDADNRILRVNRTAAHSIGMPVRDLEGRSIYDLYPHQAKQYHQDDLEVIRTGQPKLGIVEPYQVGSGEKRWIRTDKVPYRDEKGAVVGVIVFSVDITDSEQLAAIEASWDGIAVRDPQGTFSYVNRAFARLHGYEQAQELIGKPWRTVLGYAEAQRLERDALPQMKEQRHWQGEALGMRRDRTVFPQELSLTPLEGGGIVCVMRDIRERKRTEEALRASEEHLRQSQKMEAIGRLAGGIAHEFNNLLTVVMGRCHMLLASLGDDQPHARHVHQLQEAGKKASSLTHQLLALSRKQVLQPTELNVNAVVTAMDSSLRSLLGAPIALVTRLDPALGWINADRGQMEQVLLNLALNARDAMPAGGRLTIETANVAGNPRLAERLALTTPGTHVMLAVSDTGEGMDDYARDHCFEPFFTTKGPRWGIGLGLATVYGIVTQSGGFVEVESEPGKGARFEIHLPQVSPPEPTARSEALPLQPAGGSETILLVEDNLLVRDVARSSLEALGYQVLETSGGEEALRRVREQRGPVHLLLTDVIMPGMNGRELAERILTLQPQIRVLFMSGYTADVAPLEGGLKGIGTLLTKPFTPDELGHRVREVLDEPH
ncbi:MAG: PAS domain-containing sensor histidine kinase [Nitrospirae bacterium]|nr:MAG: PAS domain-containing sensor histidine kinase [Nitrospirota bacterium]